MIGYDYTDRIDPAALKAAGCSVVSRYVMPQTPFWAKALRNAEAAELRAAGFPIMCNFESTADRMRGGAAAGTADALQVLQSLAALGVPAGVTVWFSADWDVQPGEVPAVLAYLQAARAVLKPRGFGTGLYAGLRACSAAANAGYPIWQTAAWSGGKWDPRAAMRQTGAQRYVGGVQVDVNEIIDLAGLGAWGGPTSGGSSTVTLDINDARTLWGYSNGDRPDVHQTLNNAANWAGSANAKLDQVLSRLSAPAPTVDVQGLANALAPLLHAETDVDALAMALAPHVGAPDPAAFAAELVQHIEVSAK